jgi:hypothetical protein
LLAYLATVAGIVVGFAMSYSALFAAPPEQPLAAPHNVAAAAKPSVPEPIKAAIDTPAAPSGRWGPIVVHVAAEGTFERATQNAAVPHRKTLAANEASRAQYSQPLDLRPRVRQLADQQEPDIMQRRLGYAEERPDTYNRIR